jgi:enolase-phosphatase E1
VIRHVVVDIEGTTSSPAYVRDRLFPYSRERIHTWLRRPESARVIAEVRRFIGRPRAGRKDVARQLRKWIDDDVKVSALKTLQGLIWQEGFASGELSSHVYDDVPPALRAWSAAGLAISVYSSGSVLAQQLWFRHTQHGDLLPYFNGHFDTITGGPKKEAESYTTIAGLLGVAPDTIVFLSDDVAELDAARSAGWRTVAVRRTGAEGPGSGEHPWIVSFDQLDLSEGVALLPQVA